MKKKFVVGCLISIVSLTATAVGVTYAAFQNTLEEKFKITDNIDYKSFFGGGDGTEATPYLLSTKNHLYNLQQLTQLGSFDGNTHFRLETDIDLGSEPMLPIGTENNPFYGQFDGNGKIISNAVISSKNLLDVGFFGYTSIGSSIKNFVLNNPLISSSGAVEYQPNSLAEKFTTPLTLTYANSQFTVNNPPTVDSSYEILKISSNKNFISNDGRLLRTDNAERLYVSYIVMARAMTTYNNKLVVQTYTAARFRICIDPNGEIPTLYNEKEKDNTDINNLYDEITSQPTTVNDSEKWDMRNKNGHPKKPDEGETKGKPVVYTGIVAGHIDGEAENIGVYNGKLWMRLSDQESFNSLIGHYKNEKLSVSAGDLYYNAIDFNDALQPIDKWKEDDFSKVTLSNAGTASGLRNLFTAKNVDNNVPISGFENAIGENNTENLKFYGGSGTHLRPNTKVYYYDEQTEVKTCAELDAMGYNQNLSVKSNQVTFNPWLGGDPVTIFTSYEIHNGVFFWANTEDSNALGGIMKALLGKNNQFYINFDVTYSVENYPETATNNIDFVLYQQRYGTKFKLLGIGSTATNSQNQETSLMEGDWKSQNFQAVNGDMTIPVDPSIDYSEYDAELDANKVHTKDLSFLVTNEWYESVLSDNMYPVFALGLTDYGTGYPEGFMFNLLKFELLITAKAGNVNSTINNIDFIAEDTLNGAFSMDSGVLVPNWVDSGVQIYISLIKVPTGDKGIYLEFTRASNTVTARYNTSNQTDSTTEYSPIPRNTVGAKMATLTYDNTLAYPA